jgi:deoxyribonuclease IV
MIKLGPAGSGGLGNIECIKKIKELGLDAMEVSFTYGVRMTDEKAREIGKTAKELGILLSVHAPFYINLASNDKEKVAASKKRILESCKKAHYLNAKYVVFHAGFYQGRKAREIFQIIKREMQDILKTIKDNKWNITLAPEVTGKASQFGSLDELLALTEQVGCSLCVDFAHILARNNSIDYKKVFSKLKSFKHVHSHFSGIEYTQKGERKHLLTTKKVLLPLIKHIIEAKTNITVINESPSPIKDSLLAKKIIEEVVCRLK